MLWSGLQSFLAYSVLEYATTMGLIDNAVRIFLYAPDMSDDAKVRLMALELAVIGSFACVLLFMFHHVPVVSALMIWSCLSSTKHLWQLTLRRYWNDFLEFEHFKPRQLFVPPPPSPPVTSAPMATDTDERFLRNHGNGGVDDGRHMMPTPVSGVPMQHMGPPQRFTPPPRPPPQPPQQQPPRQTWTKAIQTALARFHKVKKRPPGLTNTSKHNLCSVNVVLQTLGCTSHLSDQLQRELPRVKDSQNIRDFMSELSVVLSRLRECENGVVSTDRLLTLASTLGPPQPQNDCVEWFMWLLEVVHMAYRPPAPSEVESGLQRYKLLRAVPLAQPLLILYEPSQLPAALGRMRTECLEKISQAHALHTTTYAEPIQRLSEVEWLSHKLYSHSVVDDMFTGQLVHAQHCKVCHHLSVSVQPYKVLSLPIPRHADVSLTDCLNKFSELEQLYGANGLHCTHCTRQQQPAETTRTHMDQKVRPAVFRRTALDSGVGGDSPLYGRPSTADMSATDFLSPIRPCRDEPVDYNSPFVSAGSKTPTTRMSPIHTSSPLPSTPPPAGPASSSSPLCDGERQTLISQLPDFLLIQLPRLTYTAAGLSKVTTPVSVPVQTLDLAPYVTERLLGGDHRSSTNGCYKYSLYSAVVHLGEDSVTRGHYTVYTVTDTGAWFSCDDTKVTAVNMDYETQTRHLRQNVCLLAYRKVKLV